jgi:hypothetical protein
MSYSAIRCWSWFPQRRAAYDVNRRGRKEESSSRCPAVWPNEMCSVFTFKNDWRIEMRSLTAVLFAMVLSLVCLAATTRADSTNLIANGTFDGGSLASWEVTGAGGTVDPVLGGICYMHGNSTDQIVQWDNTPIEAGMTYTLSFQAQGVSGDPAKPANLFAELRWFDGEHTAVLANSGTIPLPATADPAGIWVPVTLQFDTVAGQPYVPGSVDGMSVWIRSLPGDYFAVDNVSFTATATLTPEPGALVILGVGLLSLLAYAWRKRK